MAKISLKDWENYRKQLYQLSSAAGNKFTTFLKSQPNSWYMAVEQEQAVLDYAYALITKYGEGTGALAAEMYDATARLQKAVVPTAEIAETASYSDVAKAIKGAAKTSTDSNYLGGVVSRMVKQTGADTTLRNAVRDGAEFAWIPSGGETCAFCIMIASNGWRRASKKALRNGHASHIHANCDCAYAVRFDSKSEVEGYNDGAEYRKMYDDAKAEGEEFGRNAVNQMRVNMYKNNPDLAEKIKAQKRAAYARNTHNRTANMSPDEYARAKDAWNKLEEAPNLTQSEKERIYELFDENLTIEEKESHLVNRPFGDHRYYAVNKGHNQYKIYKKEPIDSYSEVLDTIENEVLTEMFGADWRDYL